MATTRVYSLAFLGLVDDPPVEVAFGSGWDEYGDADRQLGWVNSPLRYPAGGVDPDGAFTPDSEDGRIPFSTKTVSGSIGSMLSRKILVRQFLLGPLGAVIDPGSGYGIRLNMAWAVRCKGTLMIGEDPAYEQASLVAMSTCSRSMLVDGDGALIQAMAQTIGGVIESRDIHRTVLTGCSLALGTYGNNKPRPGYYLVHEVGIRITNQAGQSCDYSCEVEFGSTATHRLPPGSSSQLNPATVLDYWMDLPPEGSGLVPTAKYFRPRHAMHSGVKMATMSTGDARLNRYPLNSRRGNK